MARHFFTGGLMPGENTLLYFQQHLTLEDQWRVSGTHYERTANDWLAQQDEHRQALLPMLKKPTGPGRRPAGFSAGECFLWPWQSSSGRPAARNGG